MPRTLQIALGTMLTALIGVAILLIAMRGPAMILDLAASAVRFICL